MKALSLEEIAARWTLAHTFAAVAWVVALVLGLTLLLRHTADPYPATDKLKVYAGENATFMYPENWTLTKCVPGHKFIELPGTIKTNYKGQQAYALTIGGGGSYMCSKNRPERLDLYPETLVASSAPCVPATSTKGQRLPNGLYVQLDEKDNEVLDVRIHQNSCYAPDGAVVLTFWLIDPNAEPGDSVEFGPPRMNKDDFLLSQQYQDIVELAASLRY